jgi:hypothetical protein
LSWITHGGPATGTGLHKKRFVQKLHCDAREKFTGKNELKQLFQYQLPYPFFEHHIAESVNAIFVNVVIVQ